MQTMEKLEPFASARQENYLSQKRKAQETTERLALGRWEAAAAIGVSPRSVDYYIQRGLLKAKRVGGRVLIPVAELRRLLEVR